MPQIAQDVIDKARQYKAQKKGWGWIAGKLGVDEVQLKKAVAEGASNGQVQTADKLPTVRPGVPDEDKKNAQLGRAYGRQGKDTPVPVQKDLNKLRDEGLSPGGVTDATLAEAEAAVAEADPTLDKTVKAVQAGNLADGIEVPLPEKKQPKAPRVMTQREAALRVVVKANRAQTALQVAARMDFPYKTVDAQLRSLKHDGLLKETLAGYFLATDAGVAADKAVPEGAQVPPKPARPKPSTVSHAELQRQKQVQRAEAEGAQAAADLLGVSNAEVRKRIREAKPDKPKAEKANWQGFGMCELLRWCGKHGMHKNLGAAVVRALGVGFEPRPNTIAIQNSWGRTGVEPAPDLTAAQAKVLKDLAKQLDAETPAPRGQQPKGKKAAKAKA